MIPLEINPYFRDYHEPLDYGQEQQLKKRLQEDLTKEPVFYWMNPKTGKAELLDGHNRIKIAKQLGLELEVHEKHFNSIEEAELFVIRTQTTRRNLAPYTRKLLVEKAVELQMKLEGKTKTQAVQDTAAEMGISERTAWTDVQEKSDVQQFFEDKKLYERDLERVRNKEVEKLKQRAKREGWAEDEEKLADEWQTIEAQIQEQFDERSAALEAASVEIQAVAEAEGVRPAGGKRGGAKKSTQAKTALRTITGSLDKIQGLSYHFKGDFVPIDFKLCASWVKDQDKILNPKGRK